MNDIIYDIPLIENDESMIYSFPDNILDFTCKKEFANYICCIIQAWADKKEIEYRNWVDADQTWKNINTIPDGHEVWNFAYRQFRIKDN